MVRTSLTWRMLGERLVGTCHVPTPGRAAGLSGAPSVGILLLNPGPAPRSGNSDLSARIGDRLALRGFPVFRFDLPGLGDSSGPTPLDVDAYWTSVVDGCNDEATLALIARIRSEFGVERIVVGGLCAATVPAVRAIGPAGSSAAGLILLEPSLLLPSRQTSARLAASASGTPPGPSATGSHSGSSVPRPERAGALARVTSSLHGLLRSAAGRVFGHDMPRDANRPLITRWQEGLAQGVPSLLVVAAGHGTDRTVERVLRGMPDADLRCVTCVRAPATNHLFTRGAGSEAVLTAIEQWMTHNFSGRIGSSAEQESGSAP